MAKDDVEWLRAELARCPRPVPEEMRRRALVHLARRRSEGIGLKRTARELGLPLSTLHHWTTRPNAEALATAGFQQIAIVEPPATIVVADQRSGLRVELGDVALAAELIRRLR
jgi:hypothetical protein